MDNQPPNPFHIRALYTSALLVQSFDVYSFITLSTFFWPNREDFSCPSSVFFLRTYTTLLFPYIIMCYRLRKYHIRRTEVGRIVGSTFLLFHTLAPAFYTWSRFSGAYTQEPFWGIVTVHSIWAGWAAYGLLAAA